MELIAVLLVVQPSGYSDTARLLGDTVAECVRLAWVVLNAELDGSSGMAGSDDVGADWGSSYDATAAQATQATEDICNACYQLAALLEQTGINYDSADLASAPGGSVRHAVTRWKRSSTTLDSVPSAVGAGIPAPGGWSMLQHAIGMLWPNGHQDRLHAAAALWQRAGDQLDALVPDIEQAATDLMLQRAPEVDDAFTVIDAMASHVAELAESYRKIGSACAGYAQHLDAAHHAIIEEIKSFAEWTAGIEVVGGLFSVCTLGLSEVGAQVSEATEIFRAAKAIKAAIETLKSLALGERAVVEAAGVRVVAVSDKVEPLLARRVEEVQLEELTASGALVPGQLAVTQTENVVVGSSPDAISLARLDEGVDVGPARETWANLDTLDEHFARHAGDFGATSAEDYAMKAREFYLRAREEHLPTKVREDGSVRVYEPKTNTFGSYTSDGSTRTFFKPTSRTYWERQKGTLR